MGWRFRKSFSPLPDVRLNFSPRGISTSVGAGPFRFSVGSQGQRLRRAFLEPASPTGSLFINLPPPTRPQAPRETPRLPSPNLPQPHLVQPVPPAGSEIQSASTATLTTEGLEPVKELLTKAQEERARLLPELQAAQAEATTLKNRHQRWSNGWLFRRLFKGRFLRLGEMATEAADKQAELEEQERLSRLATEFDLTDNLKDRFGRLCDAVAALAGSQRIWDTVTSFATDRYRERTTASQSIQRQPVGVSLGTCDLIQSSLKVPCLLNANGGELFLYPAFVLYFVSQQAFALVDIRDVTLNYNPVSFIEEESIPNDAELVGHTWKKANKMAHQTGDSLTTTKYQS